MTRAVASGWNQARDPRNFDRNLTLGWIVTPPRQQCLARDSIRSSVHQKRAKTRSVEPQGMVCRRTVRR